MEFDLKKVVFDDYDYNYLRDVIFSALGKRNLTNDQVIEYWNMFPDNIKLDALKWGMNDTPTREGMYKWLMDNVK